MKKSSSRHSLCKEGNLPISDKFGNTLGLRDTFYSGSSSPKNANNF